MSDLVVKVHIKDKIDFEVEIAKDRLINKSYIKYHYKEGSIVMHDVDIQVHLMNWVHNYSKEEIHKFYRDFQEYFHFHYIELVRELLSVISTVSHELTDILNNLIKE